MRMCRGKPVSDPKGDFVKGWYFCLYEHHYIIKTDASIWKPFSTNKAVVSDFIEVIPETVSQSTGLKDKNGVEIFGKDIVHFTDPRNASRPAVRKSVVQWFQEGCCYEYAEIGSNKSCGLHKFSMDSVEIIGNAIDNPELKGT